jgi:hypothetical protein
VVAKTFDGREAEVFAIPLDPPAPLLRPALPRPAGTLPGFTEPVTGADLSADGRLLAACSQGVVRVYAPDGDGDGDGDAPGGSSARPASRSTTHRGHRLGRAGPDPRRGRPGLYRIAEASWRGGEAGAGRSRTVP